MRVLVTAGPTFEPIDAVRYLGNRSSGRLGCAIAGAFNARGHRTRLLLGPVATEPPAGVDLLRFRTTEELGRLLDRAWPEADLLVMAAAVADFRPEPGSATAEGKLERTGSLLLRLVPTPDLVARCALNRRPGQLIVGFALEPAEELSERAAAKLLRKKLDAIVANPLETMDAETIDGTLLHSDGSSERPPEHGAVSKDDFAAWLAGRVEALAARAAGGAATGI